VSAKNRSNHDGGRSGSPAESVPWLRNASTSSLALKFESTLLNVRVFRADRDRIVAADQKRTAGAISQVIADPPLILVPMDIDGERRSLGRSEQVFA
jgi:hypothetical protein